jgi:nicotinamide mononucleotide transporter
MYLMAKRFIEHWYFWIIGNLILVPMMFYRDLIPTAMQYIVFLILAMHGLYLWKIQIKSELK